MGVVNHYQVGCVCVGSKPQQNSSGFLLFFQTRGLKHYTAVTRARDTVSNKPDGVWVEFDDSRPKVC